MGRTFFADLSAAIGGILANLYSECHVCGRHERAKSAEDTKLWLKDSYGLDAYSG
jgi:hypothetical protein